MIDKDQELIWEEEAFITETSGLILNNPISAAATFVEVGEFKKAGVFAKFDDEEEFLLMNVNPQTNEVQLNFKVIKINPDFKGKYSALKFTSPSGKTFSLTAKVIE